MIACIEKYRLVEHHKAALDAMIALNVGIGVMLVEDYASVLTSIATAQELAAHARVAIDAHIPRHGCENITPPVRPRLGGTPLEHTVQTVTSPMNASGASILANPHPCGHIVYPYTDEGLVGQAVSLYTSAGLQDGDGVVLIISSEHCESIKLRLQLEGIHAEDYEHAGQLICVLPSIEHPPGRSGLLPGYDEGRCS